MTVVSECVEVVKEEKDYSVKSNTVTGFLPVWSFNWMPGI